MDFEEKVLSELRQLRQEVAELRACLTQQPLSPPEKPTPLAGSPSIAASPTFPAWLREVPPDLARRLQPLFQQTVPMDPKERARWLLELSENVEDFLRYQGDEWPASGPYLEQLARLQEHCGLQRLTPEEGDPLDDRFHLILQSLPNSARRDQVARCARPGFTYDGEILRRAEVVVYL